MKLIKLLQTCDKYVFVTDVILQCRKGYVIVWTFRIQTKLVYFIIFYHTVLYFIMLYHTSSYFIILYHTLLYFIILYYTLSYFIILYFRIFHFTLFHYYSKMMDHNILFLPLQMGQMKIVPLQLSFLGKLTAVADFCPLLYY